MKHGGLSRTLLRLASFVSGQSLFLLALSACGKQAIDWKRVGGHGVFLTASGASQVGATARVVGNYETVFSGPRNILPSLPPHAGTTEHRVWVPDGPPRAYIDRNGHTRLIVPHYLTYAFVGANLNSMSLVNEVVADSVQNDDPNAFAGSTWPWSPYRLGDKTYSINHNEYHCRAQGTCTQDKWYPSLTLSVAADTIHFGPPNGVIARAAYAFTGDSTPVAGVYSDPSNVIFNHLDNHFYLIALFNDGSTVGNCVLRTTNIADAGSWRAMTGSGFTSVPSTGQHCANITPSGTTLAPGSISYSHALRRFVYLAFGDREGRLGYYMRLSEADDLSRWTRPILVLEAPVPWGENPTKTGRPLYAYNSYLDPVSPNLVSGSLNYDQITDSPYLYFVRTFAGVDKREVIRVRVQLTQAGIAEEIANRPAGLYRVGAGAFYSNGLTSFCAIGSMQQLRNLGWSHEFANLPEYGDHGPYTPQQEYNGRCTGGTSLLAQGCYRVGGTGFYSNGQGASCAFRGDQMQNICGTTNFQSLREDADNHGLNAMHAPCGG